MDKVIRITSMAYFESDSGPHIAVIYSVYDKQGVLLSQNNRWNKALFDDELVTLFKDARDQIKSKIEQEI